MATRVGLLVLAVLALLGGLAWFTSRGPSGGPDGLAGRRADARPVLPADRPETPLDAIAPTPRPTERESVGGGTIRQQAAPGSDAAAAEVVKLVVRAADGRPIREALAEWGLAQHRLSCVGTMRAPDRYHYRPLAAGRAPYRFATVEPALVDGHTAFEVVARNRPCFLSVLVSGVVVATEGVQERTSELIVHLTEAEVRACLGGLRLCLVAEGTETAPRARAYLRGDETSKQMHAESQRDGCIEFQDVPPGEYQLAIYANRYASTFLSVEVGPSRVLQIGDVELEPPVPLVGNVTGDPRFRANREVSIQVLDRSGDTPRSVELRKVATDSQGSFRVFDLAAGEYALHVTQPGPGSGATQGWPLSRAVIVDTRGGVQVQVELPLENTHSLVLRSRLTRDASVELRDPAGVTLLRVPLVAKGVRQVGVLPGRYTLLASAGGRIVEQTFLDTPPSLTAIIGD